MGISIEEFKTVMEVVGAKRLPDRNNSWNYETVPCFSVEGFEFCPAGANSIDLYQKVPNGVINLAMAELEEKYSVEEAEDHIQILDDNWISVNSVQALLILATMLTGNYKKELIGAFMNETYKKLLDCSFIKENVEISVEVEKMSEVHELLKHYTKMVNPFGTNFELKAPIEYLDQVAVELNIDETDSVLSLEGSASNSSFHKNNDGWSYKSCIIPGEIEKIYIEYCKSGEKDDEYIYLDHWGRTQRSDLKISLKTGLSSGYYPEEKLVISVTDEQVDRIKQYLKMSIEKLQNDIVCHICK